MLPSAARDEEPEIEEDGDPEPEVPAAGSHDDHEPGFL